jgi:hypothetical protein
MDSSASELSLELVSIVMVLQRKWQLELERASNDLR